MARKWAFHGANGGDFCRFFSVSEAARSSHVQHENAARKNKKSILIDADSHAIVVCEPSVKAGTLSRTGQWQMRKVLGVALVLEPFCAVARPLHSAGAARLPVAAPYRNGCLPLVRPLNRASATISQISNELWCEEYDG